MYTEIDQNYGLPSQADDYFHLVHGQSHSSIYELGQIPRWQSFLISLSTTRNSLYFRKKKRNQRNQI